eukprot:1487972-Prymnesium_polylepis.1
MTIRSPLLTTRSPSSGSSVWTPRMVGSAPCTRATSARAAKSQARRAARRGITGRRGLCANRRTNARLGWRGSPTWRARALRWPPD